MTARIAATVFAAKVLVSAVLDGKGQLARTTSTIVKAKTAATGAAKMESTPTRASALLGGGVLIARSQVDAQLVPTDNHVKTLVL